VKKIYVGNFPYTTTEDELAELFEQYGTVHSLELIKDRETGRSRGFAFVEMDEHEADAAITALDGMEFGERTLRVNEAKPRESSDRRGGGRPGGRRRGPGRERRDRRGGERDYD
jgi:RNA recognition motif-containing protein